MSEGTLDLFDSFGDAEAHARTTDPGTSHEAAARVDANALEGMVVGSLKELGPGTTTEIASRLDRHSWSISPRMAPLERKGLVERTGEKKDRSQVWRAL